jgi:hypothetical protein
VINLDSDASDGIDSLREDQINYLVEQLFNIELNISIITMQRRQFDLAEGHCQRCLAYSKRYRLEGEEKITKIFEALSLCSVQDHQHNYSGALFFAEKCYNLVVEAYNLVHPSSSAGSCWGIDQNSDLEGRLI